MRPCRLARPLVLAAAAFPLGASADGHAPEPAIAIPADDAKPAWGPPGRAHDGRCVGREPCVLFIAFEGPVDATPSELP